MNTLYKKRVIYIFRAAVADLPRRGGLSSHLHSWFTEHFTVYRWEVGGEGEGLAKSRYTYPPTIWVGAPFRYREGGYQGRTEKLKRRKGRKLIKKKSFCEILNKMFLKGGAKDRRPPPSISNRSLACTCRLRRGPDHCLQTKLENSVLNIYWKNYSKYIKCIVDEIVSRIE